MYISIYETGMRTDDMQGIHRAVQGMFGKSRKDAECLYRLDKSAGAHIITIYSKEKPAADVRFVKIHQENTGEISLKESFVAGKQMRIHTLLRPVITEHGKHRTITDKNERAKWVIRKAEENGFRVDMGQETGKAVRKFKKKEALEATVSGYEYDMLITIMDTEKFWKAYSMGIGQGKAYGFGMLVAG